MWSLDVIDDRGDFHTASSWKICRLHPSVRPLTTETLLRESLAPEVPATDVSNRSAELRERWAVTEQQFHGRKVYRYEREVIRSNFLIKYTIWAEPATRRILRKERKETEVSTGRQIQFTVYDHYIYNQKPPARTFDMPKGKRIVKDDTAKPLIDEWSSMPETNRKQILDVIARANQGWREGNFRKFSNAWKFGTVRKTRSAEEWKGLVRAQRNVWSEWSQEVRSVRSTDVVTRRIGSSTFTWGRKTRKTLNIGVELKAVSSDTARSWKGRADLFLQWHRPGGNRSVRQTLRIVRWDLPLQEILASVNRK